MNELEWQFLGGMVDRRVKLCGAEPMTEARHSPPKCVAANPGVVQGKPNPEDVSTSYVER